MDPAVVIILFIISIGIYFIPTIVASSNKKRNVVGIFVLNLFFGWTLIGWVGSLVWACCKDTDIK